MTTKTLELIQDMVSYYSHHTVSGIQESHPGFVVDDFTKLLTLLEKELLT